MSSTPEYQTVQKCTSLLITGVEDNLSALCADLLAEELIDHNTERTVSEKSNQREGAASLLRKIRNEIELDTAYYWNFLSVLKKRGNPFKVVVDHLENTFYKSLNAGEHACMASYSSFGVIEGYNYIAKLV